MIIVVPYIHLINQWIDECNKFGIYNILNCSGNKENWIYKLSNKVRDFNIGFNDFECVITSYKTAASLEFTKSISLIEKDAFLIADECHYFGIKSIDHKKYRNIEARLGLSATPDRWWDYTGSRRIRDYFQDTVYSYDLEKAIKNKHLVEYKYVPIISNLSIDEIDKYEHLTRKLSILLNSEDVDEDEILYLNILRSRIIANAKEKKKLLYNILLEKGISDISHTLVYCGQGEIPEVTKKLSDMGLKVHRFNHTLSNFQRENILKNFAEGDIQVLVAIKCLDEGVDVPSTREAYFLSSTSNPREFIQRRGRLLRRSLGKNLSTIYDFIVLPQDTFRDTFTSIAQKELPRFAEFSRYAINSISCREEVANILREYGLEYLMDKLPWDHGKYILKTRKGGKIMSINIHLEEKLNELKYIEKEVATALLKEIDAGYKTNSQLEEFIVEEIDTFLEAIYYEASAN